jgi:MYXO-CTERM domain-containing protein
MKLALSAAAVAVASIFATGCGSGEAPGQLVGTVGKSRAPIVGGQVDDSTTGVVGLAIDFPGHLFFGHCSGTLIAPNLVLTARHCVSLSFTAGAADDHVECGVTRFSPPNRGDGFLASPETVRPTEPTDPTFFRSVQVRVPNGTQDFCGQDVALVVLAGSGIPASEATPIVPRIDSLPMNDEPFTAEGFGLTDPKTDNTDGTRMRSTGNTVSCVGLDCQARGDTVRGTEWLSEDARTCPGDSGGPALDEEGRVMGVTSRGPDGCTSVIYGDVGSWRDFIIETALDAATRGGYDPPFWTKGSSTPGGAPVEADGGVSTPLGRACSGSCGSGYVCYSDTGQPPGQCVPRCGGAIEECPAHYACAQSIHACVPKGSSVLEPGSGSSSGCAVRHGQAGGPLGLLAAAVLGAIARGLRRRRSTAGA